MKKILAIVLLAYLIPSALLAQDVKPISYDEDTITVLFPDSVVVPVSLYATLDSNFLAPSFYLRRAARAQTFEFLLATVTAGTVLLGVNHYNKTAYVRSDGSVYHDDAGVFYAVAGVAGVLTLLQHFIAVSSIKKAGINLSRFHFQANGVTIDL